MIVNSILAFSIPFNRINNIHLEIVKKYTKEAEHIFNNKALSSTEKSKLFDKISNLYEIEHLLNNKAVNQVDATDYIFWNDYYDKYNHLNDEENITNSTITFE